MSEPTAAPSICDHHYETHLLGGHPITVRVCVFCRTPDWADLNEQAVQLYRWGREEGLAGRPSRETLSAYDMPREDDPATELAAADEARADRTYWQQKYDRPQP
jgi:hypothetical protein